MRRDKVKKNLQLSQLLGHFPMINCSKAMTARNLGIETRMKKSNWINFIFFLFCLLTITSARAAESTIFLYNWFGFIAPETSKEFEHESGISLHVHTYDSAELMQSNIMSGLMGYDVVVTPSDVLPNLIEAGVLQKLDRTQLSNWTHLDSGILRQLQANDPDNLYAVPYLWGTTGIGYDVDKVKAVLGDDAPVNSWDLIFKEENISKLQGCGVAMLDSPSEIVSIALHYLGLPHNSKNPDDYKKAQALLLKIRPYIRYFDSSRIDSDIADGNICAFVGWANSVLTAQAINEKASTGRKIAYSLPREGALVWSDNFVVLKNTQHPKESMEFINYMLKPKVIAKISNFTLFPNANKDATDFVDHKLRDISWVYPDKETIATFIPLEPLPMKLERIRTRVWVRVKSGI